MAKIEIGLFLYVAPIHKTNTLHVAGQNCVEDTSCISIKMCAKFCQYFIRQKNDVFPVGKFIFEMSNCPIIQSMEMHVV